MDMVRSQLSGDDFHVQPRANLADQISGFQPYLAVQDGFAVFRDKYDMNLEIVLRMGGGAIVLHNPLSYHAGGGRIKLKFPAKAGGFSPIPQGGH